MRRWVRRAATWVVIASAVWLVLTYYYLGPWLPGVLAVGLAAGALIGLVQDAAPSYGQDLWPIDETDEDVRPAMGFTDGRTRRLRQLCARAEQGGDDTDLRRALADLAPAEPLPERLDLPAVERFVRRLEQP